MDAWEKKILARALKYQWEPWLKRNFFAFMMSILGGACSKKNFKKIRLNGWELKSYIFTEGYWYWSDEIFDLASPVIRNWLKLHRVAEISQNLEIFYNESVALISSLNRDRKTPLSKKLLILQYIFGKSGSYIWSAHMLEHVIWDDLKKRTSRYIFSDIDKFIGDASYPEKKNKLELMEDEMRAGVDIKIIKKKYAWMRVRDGFARPYNLDELKEHRAGIKKHHPHVYPNIPRPLTGIYREARELVYLRTRRTDSFYELIFLSRPILKEVAKKYGLKFQDLKHYQFKDLISGKLKRYSNNISCVNYGEDYFISDGNIFFKDDIKKDLLEVKGSIAQKGCVRGIARVVLKVEEVSKVQKGDVLVTYMTSPDFLTAMKKAAAFVTNEGGLTCHAAIIARELKKPCVIGTKIATKVLKDGDLVEVDADKGVVKVIKRGD